MPDFALEMSSPGVVCGIDEAGRGPLAGPVVAAAVILERRRLPKALRHGLDDSKKLSLEEREEYWELLDRCVRDGAAKVGIGAASVIEIDRRNILQATLAAMGRAVAALGLTPHHRRSFAPVQLSLGFESNEPLQAVDSQILLTP